MRSDLLNPGSSAAASFPLLVDWGSVVEDAVSDAVEAAVTETGALLPSVCATRPRDMVEAAFSDVAVGVLVTEAAAAVIVVGDEEARATLAVAQ